MKTYYYQHDETGRVVATKVQLSSSRWTPITKEQYLSHERQTNCPTCGGRGFDEMEYRLLGKYCRHCDGTGKVK